MLLRSLYLIFCSIFVPLSLYSLPKQVLIVSYAETDIIYNLTAEGLDRADMLPGYFASLSSQGFSPPDIIFGAQRSSNVPGFAVLETGSPTSGAITQPIHIYPTSETQGLVSRILTHPSCHDKSVLIIWDFAGIQELIAAFGYTPPAPPGNTCNCLTYVLDTFPPVESPAPTVLNQNLLSGDLLSGGITPPLPPAQNIVAEYVPVTIYNGTTSAIVNGKAQPITGDQIYIFIQTNGGSKVLQFTSDGQGHMLGAPITAAPVPANAASFYTAYYSYPLSAFPSSAANFYTFYLPSDIELPSSRIYFSLVNPLNWLVNPTTGAIGSQDDSFVTSDNTYYTLYDKIEFTVTHASLPYWQLVMNSTMVDYYCLPLSFYINYESNAVNTTSYTGLSPSFSCQSVFTTYKNALKTLPGLGAGTWDTLYKVFTPLSSSPINLRIASANTGALKPTNNTPLFPMNYLTANPNTTCQWFTSLWTNNTPPPPAYYNINGANNSITIDLTNAGPNAGTAVGQVDINGNFVFTLNSDSQWYPGTVTFQPPVTIAPFFSGAFTDYVNPSNNANLWSISGGANTDTITAVWQIFSCAFSVGLLPPTSPIGTPSSPLTKAWLQSQVANFFKSNANLCDGPWFNFYSQVLHTQLKAAPYVDYYTAPFDDYLGLDGTITVNDMTGANVGASVNVTVGDMTNCVIPNILVDDTTYNVTFALLQPHVTNVTFNGTAVPSGGGSMGTATGSNMTVALQYTSGSYDTSPATTFTAQISPFTQTMTPKLPGGSNIVLSGNNLTIYLGDAPP